MKLLIEITEYNKEWIENASEIPQEISAEIANAIRCGKSNDYEWIPVSERLPEHSYTKKFWLTVKLDDDEGTVVTLIGTWGAWSGGKSNKSYDAFDCWKDVMINGGIYRISQPIPKEQVLAWMPLPEPYREDSEA